MLGGLLAMQNEIHMQCYDFSQIQRKTKGMLRVFKQNTKQITKEMQLFFEQHTKQNAKEMLWNFQEIQRK